MPVKLDQNDRNIVLAGSAIALVLFALAVVFSPAAADTSAVPSTYSTSSAGGKAAYLLLKEIGRDVHRWEQSPLQLRAGPEPVTYVLTEPSQMPTSDERAALKAFVASGGRLVATGYVAATLLPENASTMHQFPDLASWKKYGALAPSEFTGAPQITMRAGWHWNADHDRYLPLYGESADTAVVIRYSYGKGEVIWWAGPTPLSNFGIREPGNLELLLASVGGSERRILWDEYFHGHRPNSAVSVLHGPGRWLMLQVAIMGAAVLATFSRRSGPVRIPQGESRLSPLEFVETLGWLYQKARAANIPVEVAYVRFHYLLTHRLGLPADASVAVLQAAAQGRLGYANEKLAEILRACEAARRQPEIPGNEALRLVQELHELTQSLQLVRTTDEGSR